MRRQLEAPSSEINECEVAASRDTSELPSSATTDGPSVIQCPGHHRGLSQRSSAASSRRSRNGSLPARRSNSNNLRMQAAAAA